MHACIDCEMILPDEGVGDSSRRRPRIASSFILEAILKHATSAPGEMR
jgi:hypothetical protein